VLDEMIEDARSTIDQDERIEKHKAIQQYIYDQAPAIFLYVANDIYGVNNRVDWTPRRDQYVLGVDMQVNP
jgi:peptide/nickel transport system substrate-binding protein